MGVYKWLELNSCVKDELIEFSFTGTARMRVSLLTKEGFESYSADINSVQTYWVSSPYFVRVSIEGDCYAVFDIGGPSLDGVECYVARYSPATTEAEARSGKANIGYVFVKNAHDTATEGSMIQHWRDNKSKFSHINLDLPKYKCPSCGKVVNTDCLHGAHVERIDKTGLYIVPTCDSCNTSKTDRIFKVSPFDLVVAPE